MVHISSVMVRKKDVKDLFRLRRVRVPAGAMERESIPGRTTALEESVKNFAERRCQFVVYPGIGTKFDSLDDAYNFYNLYSWEIGFGVRYAKCRLNVHRQKCMQEIACGCAVWNCSVFLHAFVLIVNTIANTCKRTGTFAFVRDKPFVCVCFFPGQGKPVKENTKTIRCGCPALIRLLRSEDRG